MADPTPAELIAQASTATAQALAQALGGLKIGPAPSVKLSKFYGHLSSSQPKRNMCRSE